ncbi:MAG: Uma2 family endonuclease [Ktedonobacteraceae bacterium]|nr:Uma2 family endonuclease [Ktedonobacteraceae bacterium]
MVQYNYDEDSPPVRGIPMTLEAFEDLVDHPGPYRYEMIRGLVYDMAPPSQEHATISFNITKIFKEQLGTQVPCRVFQEQRVAIPGDIPSTEPDVVVTCNRADWDKKYRKPKHHRIESPLIVVEILSPGTEEFDRTEKFARYIKCPSLAVYILVSQDEERVEVYQRVNAWRPEIFTAGQTIKLDPMDLELPMAEIYFQVFSDD